ncbi:MAG: DUF1109 family protein [Deltaproteobacteria bacterium]|nr:DUF1109 family protein [Deltaproteobacteria bacterium]
MTLSNQISHDERHRALVDRLASNLAPKRPLWPVRRRLVLWLAIELAVLLSAVLKTPRDLSVRIESPWYVLEILFFATAAVIIAAMALRAAIPGRETHRSQTTLAIVLTVSGIAMLFTTPLATNVTLSQFIRIGTGCAWATLAKATLPWIALWWAVRRGLPGDGRVVGAMVGAAAMLFSFAVMRIDCPLDEPLHLMTWHLMPVVLVTLLSAIAGAFWLRFPLRRTSIAS